MSFRRIHLRKLLVAFGSPEAKQVSMLRSDIRSEIAKENGQSNGGGDFHVPFWSDAKSYVLNGTDLASRTETRVASNKQRKRLYPSLHDGFMDWWNNKKRFNNEEIVPYPTEIKARFTVDGLDATVKVENFLGLSVGGDEKRLIYPYFAEKPTLSEQNARLGLWLISKAFPKHQIDDFRILDVLRGKSYSPKDCKWKGNEEATFGLLYGRLLSRWDELRAEY
ncbi:hypothetical protein [uncultured Roseobacter sp.]|uniref:hypothetical protein n=1 Tax=uncultured Roseobacter sp. TaxID=114847 RepID=UPI0026029783|nr:hypothetical protein [uncultured Roseobacter sp.]